MYLHRYVDDVLSRLDESSLATEVRTLVFLLQEKAIQCEIDLRVADQEIAELKSENKALKEELEDV